MAGDGSSSETSQSNSAAEPFVENPEETMGVTAGTDERADPKDIEESGDRQDEPNNGVDRERVDDSTEGVKKFWGKANHIAIVVSDIGRSLHFYTDIIGMEQVNRPDFDRHGAWLTFGNLDLHLIKGIPAVHTEDELHVGHMAIEVGAGEMTKIRERLQKLGIKPRADVSAANTDKLGTGADQAFLRDPDGYFIKLCTCNHTEDAMNAMNLKEKAASTPSTLVLADDQPKDEGDDGEGDIRGIRKFWKKVNNMAIMVSDLSKSLNFYTNIIGMERVESPHFDRNGVWLTFGNLGLQLIQGSPAVHPDDDLIVGHIAIEVESEHMAKIRQGLQQLGWKSRKNVSVPNPDKAGTPVDQAFVRDPDGYYIEFCNCSHMEESLNPVKFKDQEWSLFKSLFAARASNVLKKKASESRLAVGSRELSRQGSSDADSSYSVDEGTCAKEADPIKLENLRKRMKKYGDITQNARDADEIDELLCRFNNRVPAVIFFLEERVRAKGTQTHIPPAFYDRDGKFYQPPSFEMPVGGGKGTRKQNQNGSSGEPQENEKNAGMRALS